MYSDFKYLKPKKYIHPVMKNTLEYVERKDAVCVVLFDSKLENLILVKQFRAGCMRNIIEICAGLIEENEDPKVAAYRELEEETGYTKDMISDLLMYPNPLYVSPGYSTEKLYFYGAKIKDDNILPNHLNLDETEDIEVVKINVDDIINQSDDLKTIFSILYFKDKLTSN